jgi:hypothetical protein
MVKTAEQIEAENATLERVAGHLEQLSNQYIVHATTLEPGHLATLADELRRWKT